MKYALVKICGMKSRNHSYDYQSTIMEMGGSAKWTSSFKSEDEMIKVVNGILAKQRKHGDVRRVLDQIRDGGYNFFDLELSNQEAESLGWKATPQR